MNKKYLCLLALLILPVCVKNGTARAGVASSVEENPKQIILNFDDEESSRISIRKALKVAVNCVRRVTKFGGERYGKNRVKPNDTLSFLGVTDKERLRMLSRLIVEDKSIGVRSLNVCGKPPDKNRFVLNPLKLGGLAGDWTISKLAQVIADESKPETACKNEKK